MLLWTGFIRLMRRNFGFHKRKEFLHRPSNYRLLEGLLSIKLVRNANITRLDIYIYIYIYSKTNNHGDFHEFFEKTVESEV
jgi:hypothetical protein